MDTLFINKMPFLATIAHPIYYGQCIPLNNRTHAEYYTAIDKVVHTLNGVGFYIGMIKCNNEYQSLMNPIKDDMNIEVNYTNAGEHQPPVERNNRTIKESFRVALHQLPY